MNKKVIYHILACYGLVCNLCLAQQEETPVYLNPKEPIEKRINDLLLRMTLTEKITQIYDAGDACASPDSMFRHY